MTVRRKAYTGNEGLTARWAWKKEKRKILRKPHLLRFFYTGLTVKKKKNRKEKEKKNGKENGKGVRRRGERISFSRVLQNERAGAGLRDSRDSSRALKGKAFRNRRKRETAERTMAMDRIMCKQCGNTDADKLDFTPDRRHVYCHICGAATPLYSEFKVVEIEGLQSLEERLKNADQLIALGRFSTAMEKYRELVADFSGDYRTWLGLARAESKDFAGGLFDWEALNNAKRVSGSNPEAAGKLEMLMQHCREIEALNREIQDKTNVNKERIRKMQAIEVSAESGKPVLVTETTYDAQITETEDGISVDRKNLQGKWIKLSHVLLCGVLGVGSILLYKYMVYLFSYYDASALWCLLTFLLMIAMCGLFLVSLGLYLRCMHAKNVIRGRIRKDQQKLEKLQQQADTLRRQAKQEHEQNMAVYREYQSRKREEAQAIRRDVDAAQDCISALERSRQKHIDENRLLASMLSTGI